MKFFIRLSALSGLKSINDSKLLQSYLKVILNKSHLKIRMDGSLKKTLTKVDGMVPIRTICNDHDI